MNIRLFFYSLLLVLMVTGRLNAADPSSPELSPQLADILDRYEKANGGPARLADTYSFRATGKIQVDGEWIDFSLLKKRPQRKVTQIRRETWQRRTGFDGEVAWQVERDTRTGESTHRILTGPEKINFLGDADFDGPLLGEPNPTLRFLGEELLARVPCYRIGYTYNGNPYELWIDQRSMREVRALVGSPDGELEIRFADYIRVGPFWVAGTTRRFRDGELVSIIKIEKAFVNDGVFDSAFSPPKELSAPSPSSP